MPPPAPSPSPLNSAASAPFSTAVYTCPAPTAERILDIFATVQRHDLVDARGRLVQSFEPELTPIQRRVLRLLGMSPAVYRRTQP